MVELVVAFTIFVVLASFITLALARSFSFASNSHSQSRTTAALADALDKVASVPYDQLVADDFDVPNPCPDSPRGIAGRSCVGSGSSAVQISYGVRSEPGDLTCDGGDARRPAVSYGYLTINGCVTAVGKTAASGEGDKGADLPRASRQVNPPRPGYAAGAGTLRVHLTGQYADLPGDTISLVHPAELDGKGKDAAWTKTALVASATIDEDGTALLAVDESGDGTVCSSQAPCALALDVDATPAIVSDGTRTLALLGGGAGPDAAIVVPPDTITDVTADVAPAGTGTLALVVDKDGVRTPNPVRGSVCAWVSFPDSRGHRTVPVCNTRTAGRIDLDTYDPAWTEPADVAGDRPRYPFPAETPLQITLAHPNGTCPYVPGMLGSRPDHNDWAAAAVCSTFTWGAPSHLEVRDPASPAAPAAAVAFGSTGATLTLTAGETTSATLVWDNPILAAPAVGYGHDLPWGKPRDILGCSADGTCSAAGAAPAAARASALADPNLGYPSADYPTQACVVDGSCRQPVARLAPEPGDCPAEYCYSTNNLAPYLTAPATSTHQLAGETTTFDLDVRDTDDPATSLAATVTTIPDGTTLTLGDPTRIDEHTRRYEATFIDHSGNEDLKEVTVTLAGGTGDRARTRTVHLGLFHHSSTWTVAGAGIAGHQDQAGVPVPVQVTDTAAGPAAGVTLSFTTDADDVTIADTTTDTDGFAVASATIGPETPAGTYTIEVAAQGTGRTWTIPLVVAGTSSGLKLTAAETTLGQGDRTMVTIQASDRTAGPVAGLVTHIVITRADGVPADRVYPRSPSCVTGTDGTCAVAVVADPDAHAGTYLIGASAGDITATPVALTVTSQVASLRPEGPLQVAQGQEVAARLQVIDGAGDPVPSAAVAVPAAAVLTITPTATAADADGWVELTVRAAASAAVGPRTLPATVSLAGHTSEVPVRISVAAAYGNLKADPTHVLQGGSGTLSVTVTSGTGAPVAAAQVTFAAGPGAPKGLAVASSARTDADGRAAAVLEVAADVPVGSYPILVTVSGVTTRINVDVEPAAGAVAASGTVLQGSTSQISVAVYDRAGGPVRDELVTLTDLPATWSTGIPGSATALTNADGVAVFAITDTGTRAQVYDVTLQVAEHTTTIPIAVTAAPGSVETTPSPMTVPAGSTAALTLTVLDRAGAPYAGALVTTSGVPDTLTVAPPSSGTSTGTSDDAATASDGTALLRLSAPAAAVPGTYQVAFRVDTLTVTVPITITAPEAEGTP